MGRVFGVAYTVPYVALLITYPAGGVLLALTSARVVFVVAGLGTLAAGVVTAAMLRGVRGGPSPRAPGETCLAPTPQNERKVSLAGEASSHA